MYLPSHFEVNRLEALHGLIRSYPLATLVTTGADGLDANHIPLELSPTPAPFGVLRGHVARANPIWRDFQDVGEALAIFNGPDAYVSPSWYPSKAESGRVVPTWNYAVVHAHGTLRFIEDENWLRAHLDSLTAAHETALPEPWRVSDAPAEFTAKLLGAVVGIEMVITRLQGKWKTSQNRPQGDRDGVATALRSQGRSAMAEWVEKPP